MSVLLVFVLSVFCPTACGTSRGVQIEKIAGEWCETIRASRVVAVYLLTQGSQSVEVLLVQTPIDNQQSIYRQDGCLPPDSHTARLETKSTRCL